MPSIIASSSGNTIPAGVQPHDLIIWCSYFEPLNEASASAAYGTITPPSGFTMLDISPVASNDNHITSENTQRSYVAFKWTDGTEGGTGADFSTSNGEYYENNGGVVIRGATDQAGGYSLQPYFQASTASYDADDNGGVWTSVMPAARLASTQNNELLLWIGTDWYSNQFALSGWTATARNAGTASTLYKVQAAAGDTGSVQPASSSTSGYLTAMLLAFGSVNSETISTGFFAAA